MLLRILPLLWLSTCLLAQSPPDRAELKKLQPEIDKAISAAVAWLEKEQLADGSWSEYQRDYPSGATALATYTLLKSGRKPSDPSVKAGLRFLRSRKPTRTYSIALQMMAYEATKSDRYKTHIERLLGTLGEWRKSRGGWGYPNDRLDISNTQYAALGLRAAEMAGIKVKKANYKELIDLIVQHQEGEKRVDLPVLDKRDGYAQEGRTAPGYAAGFKYVQSAPPTGSMTTAGMAILQICLDGLGTRVTKGFHKRIQKKIKLGENWMRLNFSVSKNPPKGGWHYYYLYGLERVGSLMMTEMLAGHPWYLEGARYLLKHQSAGHWGGHADTCFALLFLRRATWAAPGGVTGRSINLDEEGIYFTKDKGADVFFKGSGKRELALWLSGFGESVKKRHAKDGIRVRQVEYLVGKDVIARKDGDVTRPWKNESYAIKHAFESEGEYEVSLRVTLVTKDLGDDLGRQTEVIKSPPIKVKIDHNQAAYSNLVQAALECNILSKVDFTVSATTEQQAARFATDGLMGTAWVPFMEDKERILTIHLPLSRRIQGVLVVPTRGQAELEDVTIHFNNARKGHQAEHICKGGPFLLQLETKKPVRRVTITPRAKDGQFTSIGEVYLITDKVR